MTSMREKESDVEWYYLGIYLVLCVGFCVDQVFSMLMAFYPQVLLERGLSSSATGLLFGSFAFASVVSSVFVTEISRRYGSNLTLTVSILILAMSTLAFAFTGSIEDNSSYFNVCLLLRIVQGLSGGSAEVVGLSIIMRCVPESKAGDAAAWVESVRALGVMAGPLVGSLVYSWQGYMAPFLLSAVIIGSIGVVMVLSGFSSSTSNETTSKGNVTTLRLLRNSVTQGCIFTLIITVAALTFFEPTLANFMVEEPFLLTNVQVSLVYLASIVSFGISSGCSGEIAAIFGNVHALFYSLLLLALSNFICAPPQTFTGPLSIFAFLYSQRYATLQMVLAMISGGFAIGMSVAPYTNLMLDEAKNVGLDVNASSDAISVIFTLAYSTGAAVGPVISGILVNFFGFRRSCALFGCFIFSVAIFIFCFLSRTIYKRQTSTIQQEVETLLPNDTNNTTNTANNNDNKKTYDSIIV